MPKTISSPALSATAAPFVPSGNQAYHSLQPTLMQPTMMPSTIMQPSYVHPPPMLYQSPYQGYQGPIDPQPTHNDLPHTSKRNKKFANNSLIKKHNRAHSQQKDRLYQDWMSEQHQGASELPARVSRKRSVVLPQGNYIGYYFKPNSEHVGSYMNDEMTNNETKATQQMSQEKAVIAHGGQAQQFSKDAATEMSHIQKFPHETSVAIDKGKVQEAVKQTASQVAPTQQVPEVKISIPEGQGQRSTKDAATGMNPTCDSSQEGSVAIHGVQTQHARNDIVSEVAPTQLKPKENIAMHEEQVQQVAKVAATQKSSTEQMPQMNEIALPEEKGQQAGKDTVTEKKSDEGLPQEGVAKRENQAHNTAVQDVVFSPNDDDEYRFPRQGLQGFLPLRPLHGPIIRQTQLQGDYNGPKESVIGTGGYLPLAEPAPKPAPKRESFNREGGPTREEIINGNLDGDFAHSTDYPALLEHEKADKNVGYSYATVVRRGKK